MCRVVSSYRSAHTQNIPLGFVVPRPSPAGRAPRRRKNRRSHPSEVSSGKFGAIPYGADRVRLT